MKTKLFTILVFCLGHLSMYAQVTDDFHLILRKESGLSSMNSMPLWQQSGRWGSVPDQSGYILMEGQAAHSVRWKEQWQAGYGFRGIAVPSSSYVQTAEAYAYLSYGQWQLSLGRYRGHWATTDSLLSSGSLAVSGNALPVPAIEISIKDYVDVPFTNGWLQYKGRWQHGWLGQQQFVQGAFLHAKNLYFNVGNENFSLEAGVNHFAMWGGEHPGGILPNRPQDYMLIITGQPQKRDNAFSDAPQDIHNALGNHLIISDISLHGKLAGTGFKLYTQTPYETGRNEKIYGRDNLDGLYILGKDRLTGLSIKLPEQKIVQGVLLEYLFTKHQGGPGMFIGQFNYYNHSIYRSGWTYQERSIGTPLFMNKMQAGSYFDDSVDLSDYTFVSNRVQAIHLGLSGTLDEHISFRNLLTYVRHFGNYYNNQAFQQSLNQLSALLELNYQFAPSWRFQTSTAVDAHTSVKNFGFSAGLQWQYSTSFLQ